MSPRLLRSLFFCGVVFLTRGELTSTVWQWSAPDGESRAFTAIPPRSKRPLQVTVVAWQYGRATEPRLKTAPPVERTFFIVKK